MKKSAAEKRTEADHKEPTMEIKPGTHKHFKGGKVEVLGVAKHSEAHHMQLVVYKDAKGDQLWARPLDMFTQRIERGDYKGPRFWAVDKNGKPLNPPEEHEPEPEPEPPPYDASTIGQRQS
jgi:hypothetical protein